MSNIGYAVFGSPKGIAVTSNGLFKELNLDKSLYLNSSHISLEKRQQVLMLRRIPSSLNNLERKDALLVVLYEQALQYGENRPGGFVGSAICFRGKIPNAEKMISGLLYLFSKIKENVDENNRFRAIDNSNWNINLPDANKEFGMFSEEQMNYIPLTESRKNITTRLSSLEKESALVLSNFTINHSLHEVDYLYASDSMNVIQNLTQKGFIQADVATLFNYSRHFGYYQTKINNKSERLKNLEHKSHAIDTKIKNDTNAVNRLASELISKQSKVEKIDRTILAIEEELKIKKRELQEEKRNLNEAKRLGNPQRYNNSSKTSSKDIKKLNELKQLLASITTTIKEHTNFKFTETEGVDKEEKNEFFVKHYFEKLPERKSKAKKRNIFLLGILLLSTLAFCGLYLLESQKNNAIMVAEGAKKKEADSIAKVNKEMLLEQRKKLFANIKKYEKNSKSADYKEFRKHAEILLDSFVNEAYKEGDEELKFITEYSWEFWEFDYTNTNLVKRIGIKDDTYFINFKEYEIKDLKANMPWKADKNLETYLNEHNDIYQFLNPKIEKDTILLEKHYQWILEKHNGSIDNLKVDKKIKLPFFDIPKS
ncbi:hypothetical protein [Kordia sp.]|uniref:hypothetical protein n=1 Tax=Kordia sp. TaxID=1965332 RepID=UPI003B5BE145